MQTVIDSILLNYEILGSKNKNLILILHGWKNSLKNWEEVGKKLSEKNKVILVDLPGMGNSTTPKTVFDTYDYANLINKFILKLKLKQITLIGHSFGGKISVVVSQKNKDIKKLILVDISGINNKTLSTNLRIYLAKTLKFVLPQQISKKITNNLSSEDYKNAGNLLETFKKIVSQDISSEAKKINVKTLIIWGENDKEVPLSSAKKLRNLITNSTLRIVWRAGHHSHLEKPEKFLEILYEFV
jgi:pimeloyl-ACP methyl ester carboxylesterase